MKRIIKLILILLILSRGVAALQDTGARISRSIESFFVRAGFSPQDESQKPRSA